ncbi:2-hydroxyacid dehydrogenase [Helicobacter sp. NHP19-012]|uniref:2-hydroxyacid dehydrogenase n=1 Tax=Helicobacter gastrofelis TaxID=2849642 RepID=A0ABN6I7V6_9HELI|nr:MULTISPECIES: D-2-hydroxyacid dehydrogenase [unclassified Helicobacter]BCZ19596.1 2-hydroxyacid dehydrogenase [Helicobacter sp. NHP19-012]GMB96481.1 2-hydroxyacid dehydrogenase [Helicobacter sp. NHP22-001]
MKPLAVVLEALSLGRKNKLDALAEFVEMVSYPGTPQDLVLERCKDAEIVVLNKVQMSGDILKQLPKLKCICITATGMNMIDLEVAKELGIVVKNVVGYSTHSVTMHTFALAFSLLSNMAYYDRYCKSGEYCKSEIFTHFNKDLMSLENKEWGIVGLGTIGKNVARIATGFGAKVSYTSTSGRNNDPTYPQKSLEDLLKTSDVISIHAPLNAQTHNLIDSKELKLLKDKAILINVGRGGIVNEEAVAKELETRDFYFATDVLEQEPMRPHHPFLNPAIQGKLLLTPHIAWGYGDTIKKLIVATIENVKDYLKTRG